MFRSSNKAEKEERGRKKNRAIFDAIVKHLINNMA